MFVIVFICSGLMCDHKVYMLVILMGMCTGINRKGLEGETLVYSSLSIYSEASFLAC